MKSYSGKELCEFLRKYGFVKIRQKGSHIIVQKKTRESTITIPIPNHKEMRIGTLRSIVRQSGLPKELFD